MHPHKHSEVFFKVGDLVQHRLGALGVLVEILPSYGEDIYNILWMDTPPSQGTYNSHFVKELNLVR